jgi:hypothetical protein
MSLSANPVKEYLDSYGFRAYSVDLPPELHDKGYRAHARRCQYTWSWRGFISLPSTHPFIRKMSIEEFTNMFSDCDRNGLTAPPYQITFIERGLIGWKHSISNNCCRILSETSELRKGHIDCEVIPHECVYFAKWLALYENVLIGRIFDDHTCSSHSCIIRH